MKGIYIYIFLIILITGCSSQDTRTNADEVTLMFVGDVLLGSEEMRDVIAEHGPDFPFIYISNITRSADILFGNLESPVSSNGEPILEKEHAFRADPKSVDGLVLAGFDILSLANNHILDYGQEASIDTIDILRENGIEPVGVTYDQSDPQKPVIMEKNGIKFGFLAYTDVFPDEFMGTYPGPAQVVEEQLIKEIQYVKRKSDIVIVSFHWGDGVNFTPTERQKELAHLAINNGAKIVIGHHPHVVQRLETYNGGLIAYSLGNFVFNMDEPSSKRSVILIVTIKNKTIEDFDHIPVFINQDYQPVEGTSYYS
jgi:poly-gamma-glutamate capsule biosynthesis protein CapA/YwtB (metallophosphatase superfamily)